MAKAKPQQILLGCGVMAGLSMLVCFGCFNVVDNAMERQAEYARSPEGQAEAEEKKKQQAEDRAKFHRERMPWIIAEKFCQDYIRGDFDSKPRSVQDTGDGAFLVSGNCATSDGKVHRIVAEVEHVGGDDWKCRELYIDAQRVR